ncbi:glycosyltransferase family 39 protein [Rhizobium sp. 18055]|uniref:ArnT family glycosyltransferase n=1 Tax=Rhizobium sp. 18055 TaxID=2681403 RepID=UPI0013571299|nr:glycosyltransferase family 39 protein [Rhizobium sp. 18055]
MEVKRTRPSPALPDATSSDVAKPLWIILAIVVCLLVMRQMMHQSVFFDGAIYASIARNLSEGTGSAWQLQFSKTLFSVFSEHPPLMMWLESIAFRLFGDTIVVEKCFSFVTLLASGFILLKIWQSLHADDPELRAAGPLALTMALAAGRVSWAFTNGMIENLLIVFTSLAIYCIVKSYGQSGVRKAASRLIVMAAAGFLIALALLTKGPVGLFPLAMPAIYWIAFRRPTLVGVVLDTLIMTVTVAAFFVVLWQFDGARDAIQRYLSIQLLPSLSGQRGTGGGHWDAVRAFLRVNAYPAIITLVVLLCDRRWGIAAAKDEARRRLRLRAATFLALVGFSASLPLLVSPRVASFYFNPSLAYFASAFAVACIPAVMRALRGLDGVARRRLLSGLYVLLALSLVLVGVNVGRPGVDANTIANASAIASRICTSANACEEIVTVCGAGAEDWALYGYLERRHKVSLADINSRTGSYLLVDDSCATDISGYKDTGIALTKYRLLQR